VLILRMARHGHVLGVALVEDVLKSSDFGSASSP